MSWSVSYTGSSAQAMVEIGNQFKQLEGSCEEPEESIKNSAAILILQALAAEKGQSVVMVSASGTLGMDHSTTPPDVNIISDRLTISIEPQFHNTLVFEK